MVKRMITLTAIFLFSLTTHFGAEQEISHINIDPQLAYNFERFRCIMENYNVDIDWEKLNGVSVVPLAYGTQGFWIVNGKVATINYFYYFPPLIPLTIEQRNDFILLTLAHEIGHGQGFKHVGRDVKDLMSPTSQFDFGIVLGGYVEQYIADSYQKHLKEGH